MKWKQYKKLTKDQKEECEFQGKDAQGLIIVGIIISILFIISLNIEIHMILTEWNFIGQLLVSLSLLVCLVMLIFVMYKLIKILLWVRAFKKMVSRR